MEARHEKKGIRESSGLGSHWGHLARTGLACGRARMWDKRHGHAPGCGWGECHAGVMCVPRMWDKRHGHAPGCGWGECHAGVMCVPVCRCRRCVFYYLNDPQTYSPGGGPRHSSTPKNPWPTCYNRSAAARESQYRYRCVWCVPAPPVSFLPVPVTAHSHRGPRRTDCTEKYDSRTVQYRVWKPSWSPVLPADPTPSCSV